MHVKRSSRCTHSGRLKIGRTSIRLRSTVEINFKKTIKKIAIGANEDVECSLTTICIWAQRKSTKQFCNKFVKIHIIIALRTRRTRWWQRHTECSSTTINWCLCWYNSFSISTLQYIEQPNSLLCFFSVVRFLYCFSCLSSPHIAFTTFSPTRKRQKQNIRCVSHSFRCRWIPYDYLL